MPNLTREQYLRRDYRMICRGCRRWMQRAPRRPDKTNTRRDAPHADRCTECSPTALSVSLCQKTKGCAQCRHMRVHLGRLIVLRVVPS